MFKSPIARRLTCTFLLVTFVSLALLGAYLLRYFHENALASEQAGLLRETKLVALSLERLGEGDRSAQAQKIAAEAGLRVTLIAPDGEVRFDSEESAETMENHLAREEVQRSLQGEPGTAVRFSETLGADLIYATIPVWDGERLLGFVRTSRALSTAEAAYLGIRDDIVLALLLALLAALLLSLYLARRLIQPIRTITLAASEMAGGNLTRRVRLSTGDEFEGLAASISHLAESLEAKNKEQLEFVGNAAHELSTPLTAISGFAETLEADNFTNPEASRHFAGIIYKEAQRLSRLVQGLLQLSRLESSERRLIAREKVDLHELLLKVSAPLSHDAKARGQKLRLSLKGAPPVILAAPDLVEQIVRNLTENAIKYTGEGGVITLAARPSADGKRALLEVSDTGVGIAEENLPHIFERFYRVDKARARKSGGNGIGLALVKSLVQVFKGEISVKSAPGKGTTFTIEFPAL